MSSTVTQPSRPRSQRISRQARHQRQRQQQEQNSAGEDGHQQYDGSRDDEPSTNGRNGTRSRQRGSAANSNHHSKESANLYLGLNDMSDALEALPQSLIRQFTLLREVEAKCCVSYPALIAAIGTFFTMSMEDPAREGLLIEIQQLIGSLLPTFEERIHVAGNAAQLVSKHVARIQDDFDLIVANEIPESVRVGPENHPALIVEGAKLQDANLTGGNAPTTRNESRREALAAKKAAAAAAANAAAAASASNSNLHNTSGTTPSGTVTPSSGYDLPTTKRKGTSSRSQQAQDATSYQSQQQQQQQQANNKRRRTDAKRDGASNSSNGTSHNNNNNINGDSTPHARANGGSIKSEVRAQSASMDHISGAGDIEGINDGATDESSELKRTNSHQQSSTVRSKKPNTGGTSVISRTSSNPTSDGISGTTDREVKPIRDDNEHEPVYCYCQQVSYGEMVGCDGPECKREWFHLPCVGLSSPPKGQWFCEECTVKYQKRKGR